MRNADIGGVSGYFLYIGGICFFLARQGFCFLGDFIQSKKRADRARSAYGRNRRLIMRLS